jgi:hypothetical protein
MKRSKSNASKGSPATTPRSPRGRATAKEVVKVVEKKVTPKKAVVVKEKVSTDMVSPKSRSRSAKKVVEPKKTTKA